MRLFLVRRKFRRGEFEGRAFGAENRAFEVAKTGGGSGDVDMVRGRVEHPHIGDAHSQVIVYALLNAFHLVPGERISMQRNGGRVRICSPGCPTTAQMSGIRYRSSFTCTRCCKS